ncbi:MAG: hypothetical protein ABIV26_06755 [Candidatus Limnocylindrales bacterium]
MTQAGPLVGAVSFSGLRGGDWAQVNPVRVSAIGTTDNLIEPPQDPGVWEAGLYAGDTPIEFTFAIDNVDAQPIFELRAVEASYRAPGATNAQPLEVRLHGSAFALVLPDGSGAAELDIAATWTDDCLEYAGTARIGLSVAAAAAVAACPTGQGAIAAIVAGHADDRLRIGSIARPLGIVSFEARYGDESAGDQVGPFGSWDPAGPAVTGPAGGELAVTDDDPELRLVDGQARFFPRDPADGQPVSNPEPAPADVAAGDGVLKVTLPGTPGRYVLELSPAWLLPCVAGGGLAYLNVTVG